MQGVTIIKNKKRSGIYYFMKNVVLYLKSRIKGYSDACGNCDCAVCSVLSYSVPVAPVYIFIGIAVLYAGCGSCFDYMAFTEGIRRLSTAFCVMRFFRLNI